MDAFVPEDVTVINKSMAMRTPAKDWAKFTTGTPIPWLAAIDSEWDIVGMSDQAWTGKGCQPAIDKAVMGLNGHGRRAAGVTKMLHLKRPNLIPICDSYVMQMMSQRAYDGPSTCRLISAIRRTGRANRAELHVSIRVLRGRTGRGKNTLSGPRPYGAPSESHLAPPRTNRGSPCNPFTGRRSNDRCLHVYRSMSPSNAETWGPKSD